MELSSAVFPLSTLHGSLFQSGLKLQSSELSWANKFSGSFHLLCELSSSHRCVVANHRNINFAALWYVFYLKPTLLFIKLVAVRVSYGVLVANYVQKMFAQGIDVLFFGGRNEEGMSLTFTVPTFVELLKPFLFYTIF